MTESLHRSYRRLLFAYPRRYRRTRGLEILTTLLDAAGPQQRRATAGEAADLVVGGLRYRFAVPRGIGAKVVAAVVALLGGLAGSAAAGLATWQLTATTPSIVDSTPIARLAGGAEAAETRVDPRDPLVVDVLGKGTSPGEEGYAGPAPAPAGAHFRYATTATDVVTVLEQARARMVEAGWSSGHPVFGEEIGVVWVDRGDRVVRLETRLGTGEPGGGGSWSVGDPVQLWVSVHATASGWVTVLSALGFGLGLLLGWLAAAWAMRAFGRHGPVGRALMLVLAVPTLLVGLLALLAPAGLTGLALGLRDGWSAQDSLVAAIVLRNGWPFAVAVGLGLLAVTAVAIVGPDSGSRPTTSEPLPT